MKNYEDLTKEELIKAIYAIKQKADAYDVVCEYLGINNSIIDWLQICKVPRLKEHILPKTIMGFKLLPPKDVILMSLDELRLYRNDAEGARTKFYIKSAVVEVTAKNMKKMEKEMEDFNLLLDYISYLNFLLKSKLQNNS